MRMLELNDRCCIVCFSAQGARLCTGGRSDEWTSERVQTMRTVIYRRLNISISRGCWRIHVLAYVLRHLLLFSHQLPVTNKRRRVRVAKRRRRPNELEKLMKNLRSGKIRSRFATWTGLCSIMKCPLAGNYFANRAEIMWNAGDNLFIMKF